jgi:hypothetical protein
MWKANREKEVLSGLFFPEKKKIEIETDSYNITNNTFDFVDHQLS